MAVTVGDDTAAVHGTFELCLSHLLSIMIRNGVTPKKAADVITTVGFRVALDSLAEERQNSDRETHQATDHG